MGVAGHEFVFVGFAQGLQASEECIDGVGYVAELVAHEELEVDKHLIVARSSGMDFFADVAEALCEHEFNLGVDILDARFDGKPALVDDFENVGQRREQHFQFVAFEQPDRFEHPDVSHRANHVISGKTQIEFTVISDREFFNYFVGFEPFAP